MVSNIPIAGRALSSLDDRGGHYDLPRGRLFRTPHAEEHDYVRNPPTVEPVAETGGAATVPGAGSDAANSLPPGYRYRRGASGYHPHDGAWMPRRSSSA